MEHEIRMLDISSPEEQVEISVRQTFGDAKTISIWVNVDGICRLRISRLDPRKLKVDYSSRKIAAAAAAEQAKTTSNAT